MVIISNISCTKAYYVFRWSSMFVWAQPVEVWPSPSVTYILRTDYHNNRKYIFMNDIHGTLRTGMLDSLWNRICLTILYTASFQSSCVVELSMTLFGTIANAALMRHIMHVIIGWPEMINRKAGKVDYAIENTCHITDKR